MGNPVCMAGIGICAINAPVSLSYASNIGSVPSPAKSIVFVTSIPTFLLVPVFGMFSPWSNGLLFTAAGVSPLAATHAITPLFMS
jgi:hypothetical protein